MVNQMVNVNYSPLMFAYQWHLNHTETSNALIEEAETIMTAPNVTRVHDLNCISHISEGNDMTYETDWYQSTSPDDFDILTVGKIYWDADKCAAAISLPKDLMTLFDVPNSVPHVALAKTNNCEWDDIGPFVSLLLPSN